jgi:methylated-DNA-[protein]-cysteine S-methyltransferase
MNAGGGLVWMRYASPIGPLTVVAGPRGIRSIGFAGPPPPPGAIEGELPEIAEQLDAYFAGERTEFDVEVDLRGDPLQVLVWEQLCEIPYGETLSYGEIADRIDESAYPEGTEPYRRPRIVGAALGRNPVPVVVPCHRVIGANGSLVGFGGGIERKRKLLELEGAEFGKKAPRAAVKPKADDGQLGLL